ncbi:MAG TPA: DUF4231 domain-containing protein [Hyphomicrobiales bacterium]|jgi:hypothetical protein
MATAEKGRQPAPKMPPLWDRLEAQIAWYDRKASVNQRAYKWSRAAIIVLAIATPIIAEYGFIPVPGVEDPRALWVGVAAGFILLLEGLQHLNKWQENWILYRSTCEGLRHEQHLFYEKAGPYAGLKPEEANRLLAERTGALWMAEHSKWAHDRSEKTKTTFE